MALSREEINRKLLHIFFGALIPAGIFYIPKYAATCSCLPDIIPPWAYPTIILAITLIIHLVFEFLRFRVPGVKKIFNSCFGSMLRKEESKRMTGSTYINMSALICSVVFKDHPHISFISLNMFIWGDAVAALVGLSIGRIKIGKKSLEGSLACFFLCLIMFFVVFPYVPLLLDDWNGKIPLPLIFITSLSVTVFELVPFKITRKIIINDNLVVPVIAGVIMCKLYPLF